jgi:hypothetical protein
MRLTADTSQVMTKLVKRSVPPGFRFYLRIALLTIGGLAACRFGPPKFDDARNEYVFVSLSFQPTLATLAGYHRHAGVPLDELLDDVSQAALDRRRAFYDAFERGLGRTDAARLVEEDRRDYDLIRERLVRDRASLDRFARDPRVYIEILERGFSGPLSLDYGPKDLHGFHLTRRIEMVPALVNHALRNLKSRGAEEVKIDGVETLMGRAEAEIQADLKPKFVAAAAAAQAALRRFHQSAAQLPVEPIAAREPLPPLPIPAGSPLARQLLRTHFRD